MRAFRRDRYGCDKVPVLPVPFREAGEHGPRFS